MSTWRMSLLSIVQYDKDSSKISVGVSYLFTRLASNLLDNRFKETVHGGNS